VTILVITYCILKYVASGDIFLVVDSSIPLSFGISLGMLIVWVFLITKEFVLKSAIAYALALLETCDNIKV
jgi:hypothetical protein